MFSAEAAAKETAQRIENWNLTKPCGEVKCHHMSCPWVGHRGQIRLEQGKSQPWRFSTSDIETPAVENQTRPRPVRSKNCEKSTNNEGHANGELAQRGNVVKSTKLLDRSFVKQQQYNKLDRQQAQVT